MRGGRSTGAARGGRPGERDADAGRLSIAAARPTRERILRAAVRLFQERGYAAVGLNEVLARAEAPKGSLYHHFPGGKEQIAVEAAAWLSGEVERAIAAGREAGLGAGALIEALAMGMAGWLARSQGREGCLIAALAQEAVPDNPAIHAAVRAAYARWRALLAEAFTEQGRAPAEAEALADLAIAVAEGGMILARVDGSAEPLLRAARMAARAVERRG